VTKVLSPGSYELAENPRWHPIRKTVWWTDIPDGTLWECALDGTLAKCRYRGETVGGFSIETDGALALFRVKDIVRFDPGSGKCSESIAFDDPGSVRFNDVCTLPDGTVLAGTIGTDDRQGGVWSVRPGMTPANLWRGTRISNGMALAPDRKSLYWTDSTNRRILRFSINGTPDVASASSLVEFPKEGDVCPDGLALDSAGNLWSAQWNGGAIAVFHPDGRPARTIPLPVGCPTALCFLPDHAGLVVTSSRRGNSKLARVLLVDSPDVGAPVFLSRLFSGDS
jgi:D-xylonolactonase